MASIFGDRRFWPLNPHRLRSSAVNAVLALDDAVVNNGFRWGQGQNDDDRIGQHRSGLYVDIVTSDGVGKRMSGEQAGRAWAFVNFLTSNYASLIDRIIFDNKYWRGPNTSSSGGATGGWRDFGNNGGISDRHQDHIHMGVVNGSSWPGSVGTNTGSDSGAVLPPQEVIPVTEDPIPPRDCLSTPVSIIQAAVGAGVDGEMGPKTMGRVRAFQRLHGLSDDGVWGPRTARAYLHTFNNMSMTAPQNKNAVRLVQWICWCDIDGIFGVKTYTNVVRVQRHLGLRDDGIVGPATKDAMTV